MNAAVSTFFGNQLDMTEKQYDKLFDINVKSTFFLIKETKHLLDKSAEMKNPTNILVISSVTGTTPQFSIGIYAATKACLDNMVKGMATELRPDGIRINSLAPGLIKTNFSGGFW